MCVKLCIELYHDSGYRMEKYEQFSLLDMRKP